VTLDAEWAQLAHEALLQAWPRLRQLIDEHRESLLLRQRIEEEAKAWRPSTATRRCSTAARGWRVPSSGPRRPTWTARASWPDHSWTSRSASAGAGRGLLRTAVAFYLVLALVAGGGSGDRQ